MKSIMSISKLIPKQADLDQFERELAFWVSEGYTVTSKSVDGTICCGGWREGRYVRSAGATLEKEAT